MIRRTPLVTEKLCGTCIIVRIISNHETIGSDFTRNFEIASAAATKYSVEFFYRDGNLGRCVGRQKTSIILYGDFHVAALSS